jgi:imidazolonepropionase-like amidohydrolase
MKILARILFLLFCSSAAFAQAPKPAPATNLIYIRAGHLFDAASETLRDNMVIVVEGDRVKSVGPATAAIPAGVKIIDLSRATVLPGLIDCHTHLAFRADRYDPINRFRDTPFTEGFTAVRNAHVTLLAGFTTVRDVGSPPFAAVDLRNSINDGFITGPRIVASGPGISITGGHGDLNGFSPETRVSLFPDKRDYAIADGVEQVQQTVRAQVKFGVDVIKILATGGVLSQGDSPGAPQYTFEELKTAADEAHAAGRKIAAHAHGAEGIKRAVLAGIDSIEHASLATDEDIRLAKEHGAYFVMDIYNDDYILGKAVEFGLPQENVDKERMVGRTQRENFEKAFKAGVKMAFGTDAGVYPHGDNAKQFKYMVQYGMTPAQAIRAATINAADLLGRSKDVGTIEAGKYADIIAVTSDPLQNVQALESVQFVMKGGAVYKDKIANSPVTPME